MRFPKEKILPEGLEIFSKKTMSIPISDLLLHPERERIHLMRLSERPSKMKANVCGVILDMKYSEKRKEMLRIRRKRETGKHSKRVCCNRVVKLV